MRKITAAVLDRADGPVELTTLELDGPGDLEVVVRIEAGGVCRTDALARRGALPFPLPGVLGHEGAGVVATVGDAVEPRTSSTRRCPTRWRRSPTCAAGPADAAVECTGDPTAIRQATDSLDVLGVCVLAGDPPPGTLISLDHERARAGRRVVGVPPGGTPALMTALIELDAQGRFPIDGLLDERPFAGVEAAIDSTLADDVRKPVLRMPPE